MTSARRYFALILILASCATPTHKDWEKMRFPAGIAIDDEWSNYSFSDRVEAALSYFKSAAKEMDGSGNSRKNLLSHFNRRATALWKIVKADQASTTALEEKVWYPKSSSPTLDERVKQILAYRQIVKEAEAVADSSILQPALSAEANSYLQKGDAMLYKMAQSLPPNDRQFLTPALIAEARVDLISTLAGQIYRSAKQVFGTNATGQRVRRVTSKLYRLPKLTSTDLEARAATSLPALTAIVSSQDFNLIRASCSHVPLPEIQDVDGGDEAIDLASEVQSNYEIIDMMTTGLKSRMPQQEADDPTPPKKTVKKKAVVADPVVLVGWLPGQYLAKNKNQVFFGAVEIAGRLITSVTPVDAAKIDAYTKTLGTKKFIVMKDDVLYPGLINLHNHTKQNNLPIWNDARGQFENRFEWRAWGIYEKSVSGNMNPWIGFGDATDCAAFRWSELQSMIWGTTYLQGPSTCVDGFGILRVESTDSFISKLDAVQAPTDLVYPNEMSYVWNDLGPEIVKLQAQGNKMAYETALANSVNKYCPGLPGITANTVDETAGLKILKDQKLLKEKCTAGTLPEHFVRYVYFIHPTIAGKKKYLQNPTHSAIIAHLAEGRRTDPYNQKEFEVIKLLGLDQPFVNFIHGVGIDDKGLARMAAQSMGLVWSPFSNLLLYSETLDIAKANKARVKIALGSDWLPTGSKGVLEEVKLAREYVKKMGLNGVFTDEALFKMLTENPAQMINHWNIGKGEAGIGRIAVGAMGSVIAVHKNNVDPFTNLVAEAYEKDIDLVVVDGQPVYGNQAYLQTLGLKNLEKMGDELTGAKALLAKNKIPPPPEDDTAEKIDAHLLSLGKTAKSLTWQTASLCAFSPTKAFPVPDSAAVETDVGDFLKVTGLNLDRVADIEKLIAINLLTQSKNAYDKDDGDSNYAVAEFPPLYACNDPQHQARFSGFIKNEYDKNNSGRAALRTKYKLGKVPESLGGLYSRPL